MKRRTFLQSSTVLAAAALLPGCATQSAISGTPGRLRTAHVGLGYQGREDMGAIASHPAVDVVALCDVDSKFLAEAQAQYPKARSYTDYRVMLDEMGDEIDAVIVATPDHTHAPASLLAMGMDKPVYCQKPLTHHVAEAREMARVARDRKLVTQMGIQVHSFYDYRVATQLIQSGLIGKVREVRAWSPKNWGYNGPAPTESDPVPETLNWDLWLGTAPDRPYVEERYHPSNWRQIVDYGCGTLGDMGVHIFDTPYNALALDVPLTIVNDCRPPSGYGFPEHNVVTYEFPGTAYTADTLKWVWYDGPGAPGEQPELELPNGDPLPEQGAIFYGETGKLLLPHFMQEPRLFVDGAYREIGTEITAAAAALDLGEPVRNYATESPKHYHQFVDACLGKDETSAPFSYASRLTEVILLGVVAGRFPGETLHWDTDTARFAEDKANEFLAGSYRAF
ncbi:Inositol 2-dehydrogenase/D-chiro-inositol 3-dehydrogenase [Neolewinella maritima]|uniref:Inositol 2-dehydrogenase/D-chiro-inositol 3-dehydrogenase n=1 Tax=Neolewinella maritima TaxID=1383882 RepID=A0ABM9B1T0_9BACT|nr:Gfo/Idh/MocA family oxidoreductase [Neolewinella maritima]CAH1000922.1 Inositol 2-dehydrogenase/D-chiro-inositol 3-dehydrogenase [Neolewinella maritima]